MQQQQHHHHHQQHMLLRFPPLRSVLWDRRPIGDPITIGPEQAVPKTITVRLTALQSTWVKASQSPAKAVGLLWGITSSSSSSHYHDDGWHAQFEALERNTAQEEEGHVLIATPGPSLSLREGRTMCAAVIKRPGSSKELRGFEPQECTTLAHDAADRWFKIKGRFNPDSCLRLTCMVAPLPPMSVVTDSHNILAIRFETLIPNLNVTFQRVPGVPVLSTALSRHLHHSSFGVDREISSQPILGYGLLTMNETRKVVPLMENDPVAYRLPIIGIWFHGVSLPYPTTTMRGGATEAEDHLLKAMNDPAIWAGCVRYACNEFLKEKVNPLDSPTTFLVCLYPGSEIHSDNFTGPVFVECTVTFQPSSPSFVQFQSRQLDVDLSVDTGNDSVTLNMGPATDVNQRLVMADVLAQDETLRRDVLAPWIAGPAVLTHTITRHDQNRLMRTDLSVIDLPPKADPVPRATVADPARLSDASSISLESVESLSPERTTMATSLEQVQNLPTNQGVRTYNELIAMQQVQIAKLRDQMTRLERMMEEIGQPRHPPPTVAIPSVKPPPPPPPPVLLPVDEDVEEIEKRYLTRVEVESGGEDE